MEDIINIYIEYKMMFDLDAMVLAKRVSCTDECSNQQRIKRYRQQRFNLGELNKLATYKPRPTVNVEVLMKTTVIPVKVVEEDTVSEVSSQSAFEPEPEPEPEVQSRRERLDKDVELPTISAVKRMFGNDDIVSIKRLQTGNPDLDWREAEFAKQQFQEDIDKIKEDARELDRQTMERRRQKNPDPTMKEMVGEAQALRAAELRRNVEAYEAYRRSAAYSFIRPSLDEYYEGVRENIGELEKLRE
jgi:hypothetical protein